MNQIVSRRYAIAIALGSVIGVSQAAAQGVTSPYLDLVWRYRAGDHEGAVAAMAAESIDGLRERVAHDTGPLVCRSAQVEDWGRCSTLRVSDRVRLRLHGLWGAILPSALLLHLETHVYVASTSRDRRDVHERIVTDLMRLMRTLAIADGRSQLSKLHAWADDGARLLVLSLQRDRDVITLPGLLRDRLKPWATLPEVRLAAGWVEELSAKEIVLRDAYLRARHLSTTGSRQTWFGVERERRLAAAELIYRDLLDTAPSDTARARLGRVLTLRAAGSRGRNRPSRLSEAERLLSQVARGAGERRERYLAELFLAAALELRGDAGGARAAYERALARWPDAQAPRVGLVRRSMLDRLADRGPAVAAAFPAPVTGAAATLDSDRGDDPWFWYDYGNAWRLADELELRRRRLRE